MRLRSIHHPPESLATSETPGHRARLAHYPGFSGAWTEAERPLIILCLFLYIFLSQTRSEKKGIFLLCPGS